MKFPYDLSEQRLSLLSKEDRKIYEYEHSEYFDYNERQRAIKEYQEAHSKRQNYFYNAINEDAEYNDLNDAQKVEMSIELSDIEANAIFEEITDLLQPIYKEGGLTKEELEEAKKYAITELSKPIEFNVPLNEALGSDPTWWAKGIGNFAFIGLSGILAGMYNLIMLGKDKAAIDSLQKYMGKVVEMIDDGINKKRGFWATIKSLFTKRDNKTGDQDMPCFRYFQEVEQQKIAVSMMKFLKRAGLLNNDFKTAIQNVEQNKFEEGGMKLFIERIAEPLNKFSN